MFSPWQRLHWVWTVSLPGPSGSTIGAAPPLWPDAGRTAHMKAAVAARSPSENFDMFLSS
jgi:hypothetical protein